MDINEVIQFANYSLWAYGQTQIPSDIKYEWLDGLKSNPKIDVQALIIIKEDRIIFSGRGTHDITEYFLDANIKLKNLGNGLKVHTGFWEGTNSIWQQFLNIINKYPNLPIFTTGHSLGAALARVITYRLAIEKNILVKKSITFGEPRSFNREAANFYNTLNIPTLRIIDSADLVPNEPWLVGIYKHVLNEYFIDEWMNILKDEPWYSHIPSDLSDIISELFRKKIAIIYDHFINLYLDHLNLYKQKSSKD